MAQELPPLRLPFIIEDRSKATRDALGRFIRGTGRDAAAMGTAVAAGLRPADAALEATARKSSVLRDTLRFAGVSAGIGGVGFALKSAVGGAIEFQRAMAEVTTLLPGAEGKVEGLTSAVKALASEFGRSPVEEARELYNTISAGYADAADAVAILTASNKLALGGQASLASSFDAILATLKPFGREAGDATAAIDELFTTIRLGKTTASELGAALPTVASSLAAVGISAQESLAAIATLTTAGVATGQAATQLNALSVALTRAKANAETVKSQFGVDLSGAFRVSQIEARGLAGFIENLDAEINALGLSVDDKQGVITALFGSQEAAAGYRLLAGELLPDLRRALDDVTNSAGAADKAVSVMADTTAQKLSRMRTEFALLGQTIAEALVVGPSGEIADAVSSLAAGTREMVTGAAAGAAELNSYVALAIRSMAGLEGGIGSVGAAFEQLARDNEAALRKSLGLDAAAEAESVAEGVAASYRAALDKIAPLLATITAPQKIELFSQETLRAAAEADRFVQALRRERGETDPFLADVAAIHAASEAQVALLSARREELDVAVAINAENVRRLEIARAEAQAVADKIAAERASLQDDRGAAGSRFTRAVAEGDDAGRRDALAEIAFLTDRIAGLSQAEAEAAGRIESATTQIEAIKRAGAEVSRQTFEIEQQITAETEKRNALMAIRAEQEREAVELATVEAEAIRLRATQERELAQARLDVVNGTRTSLDLINVETQQRARMLDAERAILEVKLAQADSAAERLKIEAQIAALNEQQAGLGTSAQLAAAGEAGAGGGARDNRAAGAPESAGDALASGLQDYAETVLPQGYFDKQISEAQRSFLVLEQVAGDVASNIAAAGTDALTAWINGTKSAEEAWSSFGLTVLGAIQQIVLELLVAIAVAAVLNALTGGGAAAVGAGATLATSHDGGLIEKMHGGGNVSGQRLASDETPRILQVGEYVVSRKGVQAVGTPALDAINEGRAGSAPVAAPAQVSGSSSDMAVRYISDATVDRALRSPNGRRTVKELVDSGRA